MSRNPSLIFFFFFLFECFQAVVYSFVLFCVGVRACGNVGTTCTFWVRGQYSFSAIVACNTHSIQTTRRFTGETSPVCMLELKVGLG